MKLFALFEQIELVEAARDRYLPMFNFLDQIPDVVMQKGHNKAQFIALRQEAEKQVDWATNALRNSDRITWYLRYIRISILAALTKLMMEEAESISGWGQVYLEDDQRQAAAQAQLAQQQAAAQQELPGETEKDALLKQIRDQVVTAHGVFQKMLKRDISKLVENGKKEVALELEAADKKANAALKKLEATKKKCQQNPQHQDCGLNLEGLEQKADALSRLAEALRSADTHGNMFKDPSVFNRDLMNALAQQLAHFESIGYEPMQNYRFGWKISPAVLGTLAAMEEIWASKQQSTIPHDEEGVEKILEFGKDKAWFNLHRSYCNKEGAAMGHCGNEYGNKRGSDEVLSFRTLEGKDENGVELWKPHLTFIFDTDTGMLGEMKGRRNSKPTAAYHPYIIALLEQDWVKGIVKRAHQHAKANDFYISDLPEEKAKAMIDAKPGLATLKDRRALGIKGDMSSMELEKVNEDLNEWGIEEIEEQKDDKFILTSWNTAKDAYEALSGAYYPDESNVDYPEKEAKIEVYNNMLDEVKALYTELVYLENQEAVEEWAGHDEDDLEPGEHFDYVEEGFDFDDAVALVFDEDLNDPLEEIVDDEWKKYHASGMQSNADYTLEQLSEYGYDSPFEWEDETIGDNGLAITMDVDYFFSDVYDNLEEEGSGSYGTKTWAQILHLSVPDESENYWEGMYGETEYFKYISDEVDKRAIKHLKEEIGKVKTSELYQADELRKSQQHLPWGDSESQQPEEPKFKGTGTSDHLGPRTPKPWYHDVFPDVFKDK